jgi:hypothetical protein
MVGTASGSENKAYNPTEQNRGETRGSTKDQVGRGGGGSGGSGPLRLREAPFGGGQGSDRDSPVAIFLIVRFFGLHLTYVYVCTTVNHKRLGAHSYLVYSTHAPVPLSISLTPLVPNTRHPS